MGKGARRGATAKAAETTQSSALTFGPTLWAAADKLRGNMDAAEYKHVALGLIFLKYISDRFDERRAEILADEDTPEDLRKELVEDIDAYWAEDVFWVPKKGAMDVQVQTPGTRGAFGISGHLTRA